MKVYKLLDHVFICLFIIYFRNNSVLSTVIINTQDLLKSMLCIVFELWVQISKQDSIFKKILDVFQIKLFILCLCFIYLLWNIQYSLYDCFFDRFKRWIKFKSSISSSFNMLSSESLFSTSRDVLYAFSWHYLHDNVIQCLLSHK